VAAGVAAYGLDQALNSGKGFAAISSIAGDVAGALQGVWDAMVGGKWELAGEIIAAGLSSGFKRGLLDMRMATTDFSNWAAKAFAGLVAMPQIAAADIMGDVKKASDLRAALDEQRGIIDQDKSFRFDKEKDEADAAAAKYAELLKQAKTVKMESPMAGFNFGNMASSASGAIENVQTTGAENSVLASRLGQSAPGNKTVEKLEELVKLTEEQNETLGAMAESIEELETLTVE
jgi:hypothetical protein